MKKILVILLACSFVGCGNTPQPTITVSVFVPEPITSPTPTPTPTPNTPPTITPRPL